MDQHQPSSSIFAGASPKLTFLFGVVSSILAAVLVGAFFVVPKLYSSAGKSAAVSTTTGSAAATNSAAAAPSAAATAPTGNVKAIGKDDYIRGDKNAKLTLVEYGDLECPYCKQFHPTLQQVMSDYQGKVRWVYRQFPLTSIHQNAQKEAEASLCVGSLGGQDKFWTFVDKVYERTTSNGTGFALTALGPLAKEVGVDQTKFQSCLDGGLMAAQVNAEEADGTAGGVQGTPTTFLIGPDGKTITSIPGAYPVAQVKQTINQALSKL